MNLLLVCRDEPRRALDHRVHLAIKGRHYSESALRIHIAKPQGASGFLATGSTYTRVHAMTSTRLERTHTTGERTPGRHAEYVDNPDDNGALMGAQALRWIGIAIVELYAHALIGLSVKLAYEEMISRIGNDIQPCQDD